MTPSVTAADLRTYVINLRRRVDRRAWMERTLPAELKPHYTSDWHEMFDGRLLTRQGLEREGLRLFDWQIDSANRWWSRPLKLGEVGCSLAHLACWRDAEQCGDEPYILILEDDAVLEADCLPKLLELLSKTTLSFDLLYLGRVPLEPDRSTGGGLVSPGYSHCTFGYVVTRAALSVLLEFRLDQALVPVDEFLPATYIDHPRPDLRARFPRKLIALACDPPLVTQIPKVLGGSDTEGSTYID